jgi:hypothetical protein
MSDFVATWSDASKGGFSMRRILLAAVALGGLTALTAGGASAAPSVAGVHAEGISVAPAQPLVTHVDYYWHRRHWHHRHWEHHRWRYWD